jgi:pimeloyl-ACP methyl ester carboxylesterase
MIRIIKKNKINVKKGRIMKKIYMIATLIVVISLMIPINTMSAKAEVGLNGKEKTLLITEKQKEKFINKYGENVYWPAVESASIYLQSQRNSDSPIDASYIKKYKKKYDVKLVKLKSKFDGHIIPADYIIQKGSKNRNTIILVHGAFSNRRSMGDRVDEFLKMGYNVLAYDQRSSGENTAPLVTYGIYEYHDLIDYINYIDKNIDKKKKLVVVGYSQGGATVARALGTKTANSKVDYAILDCPVSSMKGMVSLQMLNYVKKSDVKYVYDCGDKLMSFLYGFSWKDGEATNYICKTKVPVLIFTSKMDKIVPIKMPKSLYNAIPGKNKYIYISKTASHCGSFYSEKDTYMNLVKKLLKGNLIH